jgi:hypothetical protein
VTVVDWLLWHVQSPSCGQDKDWADILWQLIVALHSSCKFWQLAMEAKPSQHIYGIISPHRC